ncbi:dihydro-orotate oxidase, FMN-linked [Burkholderiales bacterium]|nr:dihydro-orotate oxidase, FMN-linked [Burkholderiales bacterium]
MKPGFPGAALYELARPLLFALDAERVHELTLEALQRAHDTGATRLCQTALTGDPVRVMGLDFPNPVGLAAGLDKNGAYIDALGALGFGFIEVGTVTPQPQPGNPKPRLFRLPRAQALINRLGFNNGGVEQFVANVQRARYAGVLGLNLGKNASTPIAAALDDYRLGLQAVYPHAGYVTINISSPNTRDLRSLQGDEELDRLLAALQTERERLAQQHGRRVPLAVKIAPDLESEQLVRIADTLVARGIDAVIATNTTIAREAVAGLPHCGEVGGLSGRPLRAHATQVVRELAAHLQGALPIIAVGGIVDARDAVEKIQAGASLVQLYTGLVYRGPALIQECRQALAHLQKEGPEAR